MAAIRTDARLAFSVIAALIALPAALTVLADYTGTTSITAGTLVLTTSTAPASAPATTASGVGTLTLTGGGGYSGATVIHAGTLTIAAPATATAPAPTPTTARVADVVTQPFVASINADKVYVRSGPGSAYYELGQLGKGDLVQVVGTRLGWYQILPPNGTFCMIAKEFVDADATGGTGTVKVDYVNVRAGTSLAPTRDPSAVLTVVRKGAKLTVIGSTDKYYKIAPPEKAYVYVNPQFVVRAGGTEYKVPDLHLPPGVAGPGVRTVVAPTEHSGGTVEITPATTEPDTHIGSVATTEPVATAPAATQTAVIVPPVPAVTFDPTAAQRFAELNTQTQLELRKPLAQRDLDGLIKEYKALLAREKLPPSVKLGSESRIAALEKMATVQKLAKEGTASADMIEEQRKALQAEYEAAQKAIEAYENSGPYVAEGELQTSTVVAGKYVLVNPATKRVVAYVDPVGDVDVSKLMGQYIGVRGSAQSVEGSQVKTIRVKNATLLPAPALPK